MKKACAIYFVPFLISVVFIQKVFSEETIRYVTETGAGSKNGTSWSNAYDGTKLQTAINESGVTQVWVAKGTYRPNATGRGGCFELKNGVTIYGGFAGTESSVEQRTNYRYGQTNETILSGDLGAYGRCYNVIRCGSGSGINNTAVIDGFTIRDGYSDHWDYYNSGGGMRLTQSSPTVRNCTFYNNCAILGGGGLSVSLCAPAPIIENCSFLNNSAGERGGGMFFYGTSANPKNCIFSGNTAGQKGGGVHIEYYSSVNMVNCLFYNNTASTRGGGINSDNYSAPITFTNCTFANNSSADGGGIYNYTSSIITLNNCIVWGNEASSNGDEFYLYLNTTTVLNYSCYANEGGDVYCYSSTFTATNNNINSNPLFSNPGSGNYYLSAGSPCLGTGDLPANSPTTDLDGRSRPLPASATHVDMGCYEQYDADASLPVELTSFSAISQSGGVILTWRTESETENLGFIIERKNVGANHDSPSSWSQIASYITDNALAGHGSTSEAHDYSYTDAAVVPGATYLYRLGDVDYSGKVTWHKEVEVKVEVGSRQIPLVFGLQKAYPNPFNPSLTIPYGLTEDGQMALKVYNLRGQLVETLVSGYALKGAYSITWRPNNLSSGVYFIQLRSRDKVNLQKVFLIK